MQDPSYVLIPLYGRDGAIVGHAVVDADNAHLARFRWRRMGRGYAVRSVGHRTILLHRAVMGLGFGDPREIDHRDRDRLNCRRSNLRIVTHTINTQNLTPRAGTSSHRGVHWSTRRQRWIAKAHIAGKTHHVGTYAAEREAATAARAFRLAHMPGALD